MEYITQLKNFLLNLFSTVFNIGESYFTDVFAIARTGTVRKKCCSLVLKRTFDLAGSLIGLILFGPIILIEGMVIKFNSPGPMFYKQKRVGKDGKVFVLYKIRTMVVDAESETGPVWAKRDDPRIIRGGKLIRRYHIDELPQLFNILKGEMSFVGSRPERPEIIEKFNHHIPNYNKKLVVKPGITGYAQIRHKYDETIRDVKMKLKYEIFYIRRMCLLLDFKILFSTLGIILVGKDDYRSVIRRRGHA